MVTILNILKRLFSKQSKPQKETKIISSNNTNKEPSDKPQDIDLNSVEYIPLPPSPKTWEVDGRNEFHEEFEIPELKLIFQAGWERKYTKVIKLASQVSPNQLDGQVGDLVAKAYRDTIIKRIKADQIKPAARWASEMFEVVPTHCNDTDKRRYNKVIKQLDKKNLKHAYKPIDVPPTNSIPVFSLSDNSPWELSEINSIPKEKRPDPAFIPSAFTADGILYFDKNGKSELTSENGYSAFRKLDRFGNLISEKALNHDIYRFGCSPTGSFLAIMNSSGILYVYDAELNLVAEKNLQSDKRVKNHFKSTETNYWGDFKSQVRAVDVSSDGKLFLFTLADEAWCCSLDDSPSWGVRMPLNEGWERTVGKSQRTALSHQVEEALNTFQLSLPVAPKDIHKKYRVLAKKYHPDRNQNSQDSHKQMQNINDAFEILTGIKPEDINFEVDESDITFFRRTSPDQVVDIKGFRVEITIQGGTPQDWVYGASFQSEGGGAFLATYSGKVIEIDGSGKPMLIYDVGIVPDEIVEADNYLYILTSTRLYVIEERRNIVAFIDIFKQGRLLVTQSGFGLLDNKLFQWFLPNGQKVGGIESIHPIRSIYNSAEGVVVETRQHSAVVKGFVLS